MSTLNIKRIQRRAFQLAGPKYKDEDRIKWLNDFALTTYDEPENAPAVEPVPVVEPPPPPIELLSPFITIVTESKWDCSDIDSIKLFSLVTRTYRSEEDARYFLQQIIREEGLVRLYESSGLVICHNPTSKIACYYELNTMCSQEVVVSRATPQLTIRNLLLTENNDSVFYTDYNRRNTQ